MIIIYDIIYHYNHNDDGNGDDVYGIDNDDDNHIPLHNLMIIIITTMIIKIKAVLLNKNWNSL